MKFPKRTPQHIAETASWKILKQRAPEEWVLREVNERDYGIDAYVEIAMPNGDMTGQLCSLQLKGTEKISWKKLGDKCQASFRVKSSTVNYWMHLPVPVFLILTDKST